MDVGEAWQSESPRCNRTSDALHHGHVLQDTARDYAYVLKAVIDDPMKWSTVANIIQTAGASVHRCVVMR